MRVKLNPEFKIDCTLCKAGFKLYHNHIFNIKEFEEILERIMEEKKV